MELLKLPLCPKCGDTKHVVATGRVYPFVNHMVRENAPFHIDWEESCYKCNKCNIQWTPEHVCTDNNTL